MMVMKTDETFWDFNHTVFCLFIHILHMNNWSKCNVICMMLIIRFIFRRLS